MLPHKHSSTPLHFFYIIECYKIFQFSTEFVIEILCLNFWIQVNNVGTAIWKPAIEYTTEEFSTIFGTNFESAYHLSQLAHPLLKASGAGSIVFISSVAGVVSIKNLSVYSATKGMYKKAKKKKKCKIILQISDIHSFVTSQSPSYIWGRDESTVFIIMIGFLTSYFSGAINQLTKNLACEWAKDNIRTNSVAPWYIKTPLVDNVNFFCLNHFALQLALTSL